MIKLLKFTIVCLCSVACSKSPPPPEMGICEVWRERYPDNKKYPDDGPFMWVPCNDPEYALLTARQVIGFDESRFDILYARKVTTVDGVKSYGPWVESRLFNWMTTQNAEI